MTRRELINRLEEIDRLILEEIGAEEITDFAREQAHINIIDTIEKLTENEE
jgi:hypothetical protein